VSLSVHQMPQHFYKFLSGSDITALQRYYRYLSQFNTLKSVYYQLSAIRGIIFQKKLLLTVDKNYNRFKRISNEHKSEYILSVEFMSNVIYVQWVDKRYYSILSY